MRKLCSIEWKNFVRLVSIRNVIKRMSTGQCQSLSSHARVMDLRRCDYEGAIQALNDLQSNSENLAKKDRRRDENLLRANRFAERAGLSHSDLDKLAVIHVSGTKGKGSTCALTESLLRHHGYRTGFFSSPHLVEVRERIRINGSPISKDLFVTYFWQVYDRLTQTAPFHDGEMPFYFSFLTIMAFHVFKHEEVDVAVMEVGIGGQYDPTNIVQRPVVCGVTSLGLDHTSLLGDSLDKIAWQKGGIFKPGVPAVTMQQELPALKMLLQRSVEIGCPLYRSPDYHDLGLWRDSTFCLGIHGRVQEKNASLALQLARIWLQHKTNGEEYLQTCSRKEESSSIPVIEAHSVDPVSKQGLQECRWKGRDQVLRKAGLTYYLDGAHTKESLEQCIDWFLTESAREASLISGKVVRILIFNMTGDRDFKARLEQLKDFLYNNSNFPLAQECILDHVMFTPNYLYKESVSQDMLRKYATKENQLNQCSTMKDVWDSLFREPKSSKVNIPEFPLIDELRSQPLDIPEDSHTIVSDVIPIPASVISCLSEAVHWSTQGRDSTLPSCQSSHGIPEHLQTANHIQILVTGSIHLVGGVLKLVDPTINHVQT